jgi:hypothetical protein
MRLLHLFTSPASESHTGPQLRKYTKRQSWSGGQTKRPSGAGFLRSLLVCSPSFATTGGTNGSASITEGWETIAPEGSPTDLFPIGTLLSQVTLSRAIRLSESNDVKDILDTQQVSRWRRQGNPAGTDRTSAQTPSTRRLMHHRDQR